MRRINSGSAGANTSFGRRDGMLHNLHNTLVQRGCRDAARHQRGSKETPERLQRGSNTPERHQRDTREAAERQQDTREATEVLCEVDWGRAKLGQSLGHLLDVILELEAETWSELRFVNALSAHLFRNLFLKQLWSLGPRKGRILTLFFRKESVDIWAFPRNTTR